MNQVRSKEAALGFLLDKVFPLAVTKGGGCKPTSVELLHGKNSPESVVHTEGSKTKI